MKNRVNNSLFNKQLVNASFVESFRKLDPRVMIKNPIMFTVEAVTFAMLLLIVRLAKGEEKNMMFARVFSLASNVGFWIGIVRIAVLNRSGFLMFFYITGAMLSYTAMVFAMPHKKEQISSPCSGSGPIRP